MRSKKREKIECRFSKVEESMKNINYKNMEEYFPIAEELEALLNEFRWIDTILGNKEVNELEDRIYNAFHTLNNKFEEENKEFYESANI
ncbi:MAG: hypothetical protein MJZ23_02385 [Paludibacteraceae bacterium]|nr:hypothetical protein [Paludibacteraceae bacterium]